MKDLAKGLLAPIVLFLALYGIGWIVIDQTVDSALVLDTSVTSADTMPADATDDPFAEGASGPDRGQIETYLLDIADGFYQWIMIVTAAGAACTIIWYFFAAHRQQKVVGPKGQSTANVYWVGCLGLFCTICVASYYLIIEPLGVAAYMNDTAFYGFIGSSAICGGFVYWLATGIAATPVMKPSVPLAAKFSRS